MPPSRVAPLRIARGIQNKVLEAMAHGEPGGRLARSARGRAGRAGRDLLVADGARSDGSGGDARCWPARMPGLGAAARAAVLAGHDWKATLARLDDILEAASRMKAA